MDLDFFWQIIEDSKDGGDTSTGDEDSARCDRLVVRLATLEPAEILGFHRAFASLVHAAYRFDLMAVASIVNGNVTGEDYDGFVGWLIMQGRVYFDACIADPARAADNAELSGVSSAALWRAPAIAYEKLTGRDDFSLEAQPISLVMEGDKLTAAEVEQRFASLIARFDRPRS